jgi:ferredoxin/coenzyme F420-reducing hydrogenase delta subunit
MNAPELIFPITAESVVRKASKLPAAAKVTARQTVRWRLDDLDQVFAHLGALTIYFFWIALVTGIYLFLFYKTSLTGAWLSVERLTHEQWYLGGVMRSLHRYASDAAVITMIGHLTREFIRGRFRGVFWFSWLSGVPLLWIVFIFGISGYWMVWDELAQFIAIGTARLLDWMPIFTDPMVRSFLTNEAVSERFFTLIAFIHLVGLPILLVLTVWFHLLRIRLPRINPPRALMAASFAVLLLVSFLVPATSHAPADLARIPQSLNVDWFYLAAYPLLAVTSETLVWVLVGGLTLVLAALPWMPATKPAIAEIHLDNCSACGYCAEDCPYGAIDMVPRTDGRNLLLEAQVDASLCVGCGVCVGACPASSPLRRGKPLVSGIELPSFPVAELKARFDAIAARIPAGETSVVVIGCDHGVRIDQAKVPGAASISLPCVGMLPTAFIDYALKGHPGTGVMIAGCADCHFRYGDVWLRERLNGERPPKLRARVPRERIRTCWLPKGAQPQLRAEIEAMRADLERLDESGVRLWSGP